MLKNLLVIFAVTLLIPDAFCTEKVVLQLKWEHEFQFAGYYAARWQGYYRDVGLDVEIRPISRSNGSVVVPIDEIRKQNAHFAIGALDILIGKDRGIDPVVLAPIFQRSASAVFSLQQTPINNLMQLAKLRIAAVESDSNKIEIEALFKARGFDINKIRFVDEAVTVETLLKNKADAIVTFEVSANMQAKEKGIKLNKLDPADFGMNFYGDTLYTTLEYANRHPQIVEDFVTATKKGWLYALSNKEEIAQRISDELNRNIFHYDDDYRYNLAFAETIKTLIQYPKHPIGHINKKRWLSMNEKILSLGIVHSHLNESEFFLDPSAKENNFSTIVFFFIALVIFLPIIFTFWYKRNLTMTIVIIVMLTFITEYQVETSLKYEQAQATKLNLVRYLSSVSAKINGDLQNNLSMISGFAAYISATPNLSFDDFNDYAREIFKKEPMLINFAAAKNLIVNYVYPLEGNEKVIGLDYRKHPEQKSMALQVANTGQLLVAGPVNLVQGGVAFIGRAPIFTGDGSNRKLWGIISAPLDAELLYRHSDIKSNNNDIKLAIRSYDSLGNEGSTFFGDDAVFDDPESVQHVTSVGGGTWHFAAIQKSHGEQLSTSIIMVRIISVLSVLTLCAFARFRFKQEDENRLLQSTILNNQNLLEKVGTVAKIGGWKVDSKLKIVQWSRQTSLLLNKPHDYVPDNFSDLSDMFHQKDFDLWKLRIEQAFGESKSFDIEIETNLDVSEQLWLRIIANVNYDTKESCLVTGTLQDVTNKVLSAKIIKHQATYDPLTELPNRTLFNDRLTNAIENAHRTSKKIAVLFIDLDRFKPVNDNHGHETGDKVLIEAARRIESCVRESDTVSRISGDEFGVMIVNINQYKDVLKISDQILDALQVIYRIGDVSVYCSASIGITIFPHDGIDAQALLRKADQAMYEVKASGKNGWQFYTKEMQIKSEYRHVLLNQLISAIKNNELIAYYQPIFNLQTNKIVKCESLARWQDNNKKFISPAEFISLAEESGLVNKIDLSILESSTATMLDIKNGYGEIGLAINVSPRLFNTKDKAIDSWLKNIRLKSQQLDITVEITERLLTDDSEKALNILEQLKTYGVKIAIDDFGTGYSSLSYLIKFPVDIIKVDRTFIGSIGKKNSAETLIETVLVMAKKLGIQVIAEGVENQQQLDFLIKHQCDFGQGYYLGKPMNVENLKAFIKKQRCS